MLDQDSIINYPHINLHTLIIRRFVVFVPLRLNGFSLSCKIFFRSKIILITRFAGQIENEAPKRSELSPAIRTVELGEMALKNLHVNKRV